MLSQRGSLQRQPAQSQAARQSARPNLHHAPQRHERLHHETFHHATPNRDPHAAHDQSVHQRHVRSDPHEHRALNVLIGQPERRERSETTPEMIAGGKEILETLIKHLDFEAEIRLSGEGSETVLNVAGTSPEAAEELGSLIGRRGERLQAIQHLVNLMLSRKLGEWARVTVDIEEYRGRREAQLRALARKAGERVRETGRAVQLEPMTALERRWVHMELQGAPGIATESAGEEPERRVVVIPA